MSTGPAPASKNTEPQPVTSPAPPPPRPRLSVGARFALSIAAASAWFAFSTWFATPWIADLSAIVGVVPAWLAVLAIALVPGWLNAFLVWSLLLDRPPALRLERDDYPHVTVLVAAYDEQARIGETLRSLAEQDYPGRVSVLVVDDGSHDYTRRKVRHLSHLHPGLRLISAKHGGKAHALDAGLPHVATEYVVTIDADTWLHPQALRRIMARFLDSPKAAAVAGCVLARNSRENLLTRMQEWDYFLAIASVKRQQALYRGTLVAQGAFSAYRTEAIREAGGWPELIGEDIVLTWALIEKGHEIGFEASAIAFTDVPVRLRSFARQRKRWARGMVEGLRVHGDVIVKRPALVSFLMGLDLLFPVLDLAYTAVFLPGLVLAATGRFWIAGPLTLAILPLTVLITLVMQRRQKAVFDELGLRVRKNPLGYVAYLLLYQAIMSPVCVVGYAEELLGLRRRW